MTPTPTLRALGSTDGPNALAGGDGQSVTSQPYRLFRTFWTCGGTILFRDDQDQRRPINIISLRGVRHDLWRMARDARGAERTQLSRLYAEASETLEDAMKVRMSAQQGSKS